MSKKNLKRPEWVPEEAEGTFASHVMEGIHAQTRLRRPLPKRRELSLDDYEQGVLEGDRVILARAITLVESNAPRHFEVAQELLQRLLPHTGNSLRIGISGVPGAGKSTFIEAFGNYLTGLGHKVAVLAVDPSSTLTGGSILGDKTRMRELSSNPKAFIRPSPSGGVMGGVARKSRETMLLCEAAGYDVILIETVGVGQNEITVRSMVDFFTLVLITGAGDDLQGMKKGVMEICDAILVNKADGENRIPAEVATKEYVKILHYLRPATEGWTSRALSVSAIEKQGLSEVWEMMQEFQALTKESGVFDERRQHQTMDWVYAMVLSQLEDRFYSHQGVKDILPKIKDNLRHGTLSATMAATKLLEVFDRD